MDGTLNKEFHFLAESSKRLAKLAERIEKKDYLESEGSKVRVGVDLGTANVVLVVLDSEYNPIAARSVYAHVVRDGIVVDFIGATRLIRKMKEDLEQEVGRSLERASCAIPPAVHPSSVRIIRNTLEAAGFEVDTVLDEPEAAALALGIQNGAVVDVGGGTTGISVIRDGKAVFSADEATGGTHMSLVVAGAYGIDYESAETFKCSKKNEREVFAAIRPVVEKMAAIVANNIAGQEVEQVFVVGGACCFSEFEKVFSTRLKLPVYKPDYPLLVTPLGIAMSCGKY